MHMNICIYLPLSWEQIRSVQGHIVFRLTTVMFLNCFFTITLNHIHIKHRVKFNIYICVMKNGACFVDISMVTHLIWFVPDGKWNTVAYLWLTIILFLISFTWLGFLKCSLRLEYNLLTQLKHFWERERVKLRMTRRNGTITHQRMNQCVQIEKSQSRFSVSKDCFWGLTAENQGAMSL